MYFDIRDKNIYSPGNLKHNTVIYILNFVKIPSLNFLLRTNCISSMSLVKSHCKFYKRQLVDYTQYERCRKGYLSYIMFTNSDL